MSLPAGGPAQLRYGYGMGIALRVEMPILYSISGRAESYVEPIAKSANAQFERALAEKLKESWGERGSARETGKAATRAYEAKPGEAARYRPAMVAAQMMRSPVIFVRADSRIDEAEGLMRTRGIRHLPVVDGAGALVGILSDRDVIRHPRPAASVSEAMTCRVLTATQSTLVKEIAPIDLWA